MEPVHMLGIAPCQYLTSGHKWLCWKKELGSPQCFSRIADTIIITNRFYLVTAIQSYFCEWLFSQFCCNTLAAPIWTALSQFAEVSAKTPVAIETSRSESQQMADVLAATEQNIIVFLVPSLSWWSKNSFCAQCWLSRILTCGNRSFLIQWLIKCHWA